MSNVDLKTNLRKSLSRRFHTNNCNKAASTKKIRLTSALVYTKQMGFLADIKMGVALNYQREL